MKEELYKVILEEIDALRNTVESSKEPKMTTISMSAIYVDPIVEFKKRTEKIGNLYALYCKEGIDIRDLLEFNSRNYYEFDE